MSILNKRFINVATSMAIVLALVLGVVALRPPVQAQDTSAAYWPTDGWLTSTPEEQGMSSEELAVFFDTYSQDYFHLDSLVVIRHGYIVAEAYAPPTQVDTIHHMYSSSKSVTSVLIGILIGDGYLESVDVPVLSLFPDRTFENMSAEKEAMTVRDVLTMSAGLECTDLTENWATSAAMEATDDWVQAALDLPMGYEPGTQLVYCNPYTHILSGIITELTGMSALDYAAEKLFTPLGITDYAWSQSPTGVSYGYSELQLNSRDMAKIAYLMMNGGEWDGQQIVPVDFVEASITTQLESPWPDTSYGFKWWRMESVNLTYALGALGQYIFMDTDRDIIAVLTGGFTESIRIALHAYPFGYALAGLSAADEAMVEDVDGMNMLMATLDTINNPSALPVSEMPAAAAMVSGQSFGMFSPSLLTYGQERRHIARRQAGEFDTIAVTLTFDDSDEALLTVVFADEEAWTVPVGLDGLYRISDGRMGTMGFRGEWITPDTFRVYMKYVGDGRLRRIDFTCMPGALDIISYEYGAGQATAFQAMMIQ